MWCLWTAVLLVSCALVSAEGDLESAGAAGAAVAAGAAGAAGATTRAPRRTLDRQAAELAWRSWLQSPESGNPNAPPRRITTKSLFITPLVCPKGQRLDRNGCVQTVTVNRDEHERILLEQLNNLFTPDVMYDYGDDEPGPLQLSIPIGLDPQAAPLQGQEPSAQAQELQLNYVKVNKKEENKPDMDAGIVAELELLKLQRGQTTHNDTISSEDTNVLNHNVLNNLMPPYDKPKRDSPIISATEIVPINNRTDEGQKEIVYGHVNVDPVLYDTESQASDTEIETENPQKPFNQMLNTANLANINTSENTSNSTVNSTNNLPEPETISNASTHILKKEGYQSTLNPEHDYADIGEAIKIISRYADVTTDDKFTKDQKKFAIKDDSILGTRTKLQHRRNKPKADIQIAPAVQLTSDLVIKDNMPIQSNYPKTEGYYRYPWQGQRSQTPPPDYPFRHLQDYWPGRSQVGGVYNAVHENPRRHHHTYSHFKTHGPYAGYPGSYSGLQEVYPGPLQYPYRGAAARHARPMRSHANNQDLYSLLGLRHWFSSEGTSKR